MSGGDASTVADAISPWPPDRSLLAVDGIDGSGKSVFARHLVRALEQAGVTSVRFSVDDFRRPVSFADAGGGAGGAPEASRGPADVLGSRSEADIYYEDYYDLVLLDRCLAAFAAGTPSVVIPIFDSAAHRLDGERTLWLAAATVAVVEGVFALRLGHVAANATLIYVRTSFEAARQRILTRDIARGRTRQDVEHRIDARYFPAQERYLGAHAPVARADLLIEHELLGAPRIARDNPSRVDARIRAAIDQALRDFATARPVG